MSSVVLCTPSRGEVRAEYTSDLVELIRQNPTVRYAPALGCYVGNLRQTLAETVLSSGASHLLFIDSDMRFPPDTVKRLLKMDRSVIGANCRIRTATGTTARRLVDGQWRMVDSTTATGYEEVDVLGFGVTLINMQVFKKLERPWFAMPWDSQSKNYVGEDVYFSFKAREAGFGIYIDHELSREIGHIGNVTLEIK